MENGRRFQLFSPSPLRKGSSRRTAAASTGNAMIRKVSMYGGSRARTAKMLWNQKSGLGAVSISVGSGLPLGPAGPKTAAQKKTRKSTMPHAIRSRPAAFGKNGMPRLGTSRSYVSR